MKKTVMIVLLAMSLMGVHFYCLAGTETDEINDFLNRCQTANLNPDISASLAFLAFPYEVENFDGETRVFSEEELSANLAANLGQFTPEKYEFRNRQITIDDSNHAAVTCEIFMKIESREILVPAKLKLVKQDGWKIKKVLYYK
jgi:hypothetical protein